VPAAPAAGALPPAAPALLHVIFAPPIEAETSRHPMPYALASTPQVLVAAMQHVPTVPNDTMHSGAAGSGGMQVPFTW
jgi:hypothetical protein